MNTVTATKLIKSTVRRSLIEALEQTLDIEIPKAVREALKADSARLHARPAAPAVTTRASAGKCAAIWAELDRLRAAGKVPELEDVRKLGARKHWNENTTRIQFYRWRHDREVGKASA